MILFSHVYKEVNGDIVLRDINFNIKKDEFAFIYNENENVLVALRKLLCNKEKPDRGFVRLFNKVKNNIELYNYRIGIVYKENILLNNRNLKENLKFVLTVKGLSYNYYRNRIKRVLKIVDLETESLKLPSSLLPHQLKRANIAQALLAYPSLIILENPTYNLDEVNSRGIYNLLKEINNMGITIVLLTSDDSLIPGSKNRRVVNLKEGEILAEKI